MVTTRWTAAAAAAALGLVLAACAPESATKSDDDGPIKIGVIADLTGATGAVGTPYNEGMLGYVEWVNDQGGVDGRDIEAISKDYRYEVPEAERLYKEYVNEGVVAIQGWGTGDSEALMSKVKADELPFMSASYAEVLTDPEQAPYNFVVAPTYSDQARVALNWIAEDGPGSEVAMFHHDSPFGLAPVEDAEKWVADQGLDLKLKAYPMPADAANFVGLLTQANKQGAKYIIIQNVSSPAAQVAKDIDSQGLDMKIVCLNWCSDELFIDGAGAAADGHVMIQPIAPGSAAAAGNADIETFLKDKGSSLEEKGLHYAQGWYTMHVMVEGIRAAAEDGDLSGESIKEALETMGAVDTGGVVGTGEVEFSAESHRGQTGSGVYVVEGGAMKQIESGVTPQ
jgi:branched-chain amino acid transport system substrate-binding protein